ncbi:hypothetical protein ACFTAO_29435 [Paenibacillus rhizoplanae]
MYFFSSTEYGGLSGMTPFLPPDLLAFTVIIGGAQINIRTDQAAAEGQRS